jgi:methylmalonyl-CoA mutase N-terminal domain/subunit
VLKVDPATEEGQILALELHRASRDDDAVDEALAAVKAAAEGEPNLLYPMRDALRLGATLGEASATLEGVFGRYEP